MYWSWPNRSLNGDALVGYLMRNVRYTDFPKFKEEIDNYIEDQRVTACQKTEITKTTVEIQTTKSTIIYAVI